MASSNHSSVPEGFKEIPGHDGRYSINEKGQVWSALSSKILSQHLDSQKKYLQSLMMVVGRKAGLPRYIHKLVAFTWLDLPPGEIGTKRGQYCVNHKDGNKMNNHVSNLEWITCDDNTRHAWQQGLNTQIGETSTSSKLSSKQVRSIRLRLINGESSGYIADEYSVSKGCIEKLRMYSNWKHQDHDLVLLMIEASSSKNLRKFYEQMQSGIALPASYQQVEQFVQENIIIETRRFKRKRDLPCHWYYQI